MDEKTPKPFELRVAKQAILEWLKTKLPIDRVLHETLQEHRVGSSQRKPISNAVYYLIRNWGLYIQGSTQAENRDWMRKFESALEESFEATPEKLLTRHEAAKPRFLQNPQEHLRVVHRIPPFLIEEIRDHIEDWHDYLHTMISEAPFTVRMNPMKVDSATFLKRYESFKIKKSDFVSGSFIFEERWLAVQDPGFKEGLFEIQDESSQLVSLIAQPKESERVLDLCAGAGGKSLHLATLMQGKGELIAYDINQKKLGELSVRARRAGLNNIRVASQAPINGNFDLVLVDAPCSSLGTLRRNPDRIYHFTDDEARQLSTLQSELLRQAQNNLKPGGRIVYSTCTVRPQENIFRINEFLSKSSLKLQSVSDILKVIMPYNSDKFLAEMKQSPANRISQLDKISGAIQLGPSLNTSSHASGAIHGDGFFIALVK